MLQTDQLRFQLAELRTPSGQLVTPLRLRKAPVVDEPRATDALREQLALPAVRVKLEPESLLDKPSLRTHVPTLNAHSDHPNENPHPLRR